MEHSKVAKLVQSTTEILKFCGPFCTSVWAVLDVAVGRFWPNCGPLW